MMAAVSKNDIINILFFWEHLQKVGYNVAIRIIHLNGKTWELPEKESKLNNNLIYKLK